MCAVTVIEAWPMVFCSSRKSAPARRASDAYVCRRSCTRRRRPAYLDDRLRHSSGRFQFSSPNSEPFGDVMAGWPGAFG